MCIQDISHEANTKVYIIEIIKLLAQTRTFPTPLIVMAAILVNNLIVTFLIPPAKLLVQYMLRSLMRIQLMPVLEWPQANIPTTSPLIPVTIL